MKEFLYTGNLLRMSIILIIGIVICLISIVELVRRLMKMDYTLIDRKLMLSIRSLGGIAFMSGIFFQTVGLYDAFQAIRAAADISPAIVMGGVFVSFYTTLFGIGVCLGSFIVWYVLKMIFMRQE